jgi:surface carbohydrate biosynthesis protein
MKESKVRSIDVLFLVEHVDREFDAVTCIVERLRSNFGLTADVRNYYYDIFFSLRRYDPKIVVFPFFYGADHFHPIAYIEQWPNAHFVNLGWEQVLQKVDVAMKVPRDETTKTRVHHICWSQQHCDFMSSHGVRSDKLHLAGNPVMQFYELPYRNYFRSRKDIAVCHGLDPEKKWVLFPENYFFAFLSDEALKNLADHQRGDLEHLRQSRAYCDQSLKLLFEWTKDLSGVDDPIFVLRPRPATTRDAMIGFMHSAVGEPGRNVRIIKAHTAREWILAADHIISSYSTTLIEAALAGKPVHMFSPVQRPQALASEWHQLVPKVQSRETLLEAIRSNSLGATGEALAAWARAQLLPSGDPFDHIAHVIASLHSQRTQEGRAAVPDHEELWPTQIIVEKARKLIQRRPSLHRHTKGYEWTCWGKVADVFGADDVATRVSRWRRIRKSADVPSLRSNNGRPAF